MRVRAVFGWSLAISLTMMAAPASFGPRAALAQSAADKATARQLATEGIELFRAGKHAEALDKLQRAQKLFDAPPHLLYIARSQVALGKLVEGAETYRTLARTELSAGAPAAFKQAVSAGEKELEAVEPKIPAVRIQVQPENVPGLELRIDDESVPAAVVGIDRSINPGQHTIQVSAPGFRSAQLTVEIKAGEKKPVTLELTPDDGHGAAVAPTPGEPVAGPGPQPGTAFGPGSEPPPASSDRGGKVGFMLGARLGFASPSGQIVDGSEMSDTFGPGGGLEVHGGVRFARHFTGKLMLGGYGFRPEREAEVESLRADNTTNLVNAGIALQAGSARGRLGGFGEIGYLFLHEFRVTNKLTDANCEITRILRAPALVIGGGASIPIGSSWHLTPFANYQWGTFDQLEVDSGCGFQPSGKPAFEKDRQRGHGMLFIGIGGELLFGADKPVK
jgi:hypothetical protein